MGLGDILSKLTAIKELILEKAPDALDRISDVCGQMQEASKQAAEWLRNLSAANKLFGSPQPEEYERFDSFINELRTLAKKPPTDFIKMRGDDDSDLSAVGQSNLLKALLSLTAAIEDKLHEQDFDGTPNGPEDQE